MGNEEEVRAVLAATVVPPSRVDLGQVLRDGQRRRRLRRSAGLGGTVAILVAVALAVPVAISSLRSQPQQRAAHGTPVIQAGTGGSMTGERACGVSKLAAPPVAHVVHVTTVDPSGRYIGGQEVVGQNFVPILWTDGKPQVLPVHAQSASVDAINQHGVVVGVAYDGSGQYVYRYQNGTVTRLRGLAGYDNLFPSPAINSGGDIVINTEPVGAVEGAGSVALMWRAGTDTAVKLPLPAGANVFGIADDGTMIGGEYVNGVATHAFIWNSGGNGRQLAAAGGRSIGYAVRGDWATGGVFSASSGTPRAVAPGRQVKFAGPTTSPIRWNLRTGSMTVLPAAGDANGISINASGWIVTDRNMVFRGATPVPLDSAGPGLVNQPVAIADNGLVVGEAVSYPTGSPTASAIPVIWHC